MKAGTVFDFGNGSAWIKTDEVLTLESGEKLYWCNSLDDTRVSTPVHENVEKAIISTERSLTNEKPEGTHRDAGGFTGNNGDAQ